MKYIWSLKAGTRAWLNTNNTLADIVTAAAWEILDHVDYEVREDYGQVFFQFNLTKKSMPEFDRDYEPYDEEHICEPASPEIVASFLNDLAQKFNKNYTFNIQYIEE
ncbi:TPA: hypothetical protein QDB06_000867 [Burkholderia vietnamiensis]|nr:hypothetical protein [Burkholderia vietnamiensis]